MLNKAEINITTVPEFGCIQTPEEYLGVVMQHSPVVRRTVGQYGSLSIRDYLRKLNANPADSYQERNDLFDIIHQYTHKLLGDSVARRAAQEFCKNPVILTANHHGVDYFSHSFQASLMFSLYRQLHDDRLTTVPIFSCGNIPLDNATYPQGMMLYRTQMEQLRGLPIKLPVFSNSLRRQLVSTAKPFDREMVQRAKNRLQKMVIEKQIPSELQEAGARIFAEDYGNTQVLDQASYSDQVVLINNLIWKKIFKSKDKETDLVYLELEKIVEKVLQIDLRNEDSLIYKAMFEPALREAVLHELDGARACWHLHPLRKWTQFGPFNDFEKMSANGNGTLFFWGINASGRRIPLYITPSAGGGAAFIGVDDHNQPWQLNYSPEFILEALYEGRLLPSLFTCFLVLALARGVRCIGSYFQGEYLPHMQQGFVNALRKVGGYNEIADGLDRNIPNFYLSGMLPVMTSIESDFLVPAGPVEVIAAGGLSDGDLEKMLATKVRDAHIASLMETLPDFIPWIRRVPDWKHWLSKDSLRRLEGNVVIK